MTVSRTLRSTGEENQMKKLIVFVSIMLFLMGLSAAGAADKAVPAEATTSEELLQVIHSAQLQLAHVTADEASGHPLLYENGGLSICLETFKLWGFGKGINDDHLYLDLYLRVINETDAEYIITGCAAAELNGWSVQIPYTHNVYPPHTKSKAERIQFSNVDTSADVHETTDIQTIVISLQLQSGDDRIVSDPAELVMNPETGTLFRAP